MLLLKRLCILINKGDVLYFVIPAQAGIQGLPNSDPSLRWYEPLVRARRVNGSIPHRLAGLQHAHDSLLRLRMRQ